MLRRSESVREWEYRLKRVIWIAGFFAALSLKAGNFLGKGDIVQASRVGEQASSESDAGFEKDELVSPAQQPGSSLAEKVDPNFKGHRSPGLRPPIRFRPTGFNNQYLIEDVDPTGPYRHLQDKVGKKDGKDQPLSIEEIQAGEQRE